MEEIFMDELDYKLRKMYGYWGRRYLIYLMEHHPEAWILFTERADGVEILFRLNVQCQFRMRAFMEEVVDGEKVNSHTVGTGLGKGLYRSMVEAAKKIVFDDCLELLKYSTWMEEAPKLKKLLEEFEEKNEE